MAVVDSTTRQTGTAIRAIEGNRFGGYLVAFTTTEENPDLYDTFFDDDTDYMLSVYPVEGAPVLYQHAMDRSIRAVPIGKIDRIEYHPDRGIWAEGENRFAANYRAYIQGLQAPDEWKREQEQIAEEYQTMLQGMINRGMLAWSSGTVPEGYEVEENGHMRTWPIVEGSLTPSPATPTGTRVNALRALFDALFREPNEARETADDSDHEGETAAPLSNDNNPTRAVDMTEEQLRQLVQQMIAEYIATMNAEADAPLPEDEQATMADVMEEEVVRMNGEEPAEDPEQVRSLIVKNLGQLFAAGFRAVTEAREQARSQRSTEVNGALRGLNGNQNHNPKDDAGAGRTTNGRVQVGDTVKYAHLTASDMAFALQMKLAQSKRSGLNNVRLDQVVSQEFLDQFAAKTSKYISGTPYKQHHDNVALRSAVPFRADEFIASDISGQGSDWVGEFWSTDLWRKERYDTIYDRLVTKGIWTQELPAGVDVGKFPTEGADPVAYSSPQANDLDSTGRPEATATINYFATGNVSVTPGEVKMAIAVTRIMDEDSLINMAQQSNRQLNESIIEYRDRVLINADSDTTASTNINLIDGTPATGNLRPYYLATNGFRKLPLVTASSQSRSAGGSLALSDYRQTLALMDGELRQYKDRLMFIIDPDTEMASLGLAEIATDDVRRTNATITSGILENVYGVEVASNGFLPLSNSAGKVSATAGNNTLGSIALIYAPYWGVAYKRNIDIEEGYDVVSGTTVYVASMRIGVVARGNNAAAITYNVGV